MIEVLIISLVVDDMAMIMVQCNYSAMHLPCFGGVAPSLVTSKAALLAAQTYDC